LKRDCDNKVKGLDRRRKNRPNSSLIEKGLRLILGIFIRIRQYQVRILPSLKIPRLRPSMAARDVAIMAPGYCDESELEFSELGVEWSEFFPH